jgi:hypothetical protein
MDSDEICQELISIADNQLIEIERILPKDPFKAIVLLIEIIRVKDYWEVSKNILNMKGGISIQDLDLIRMGWNLATSFLFKPITEKGVPIQESTEQSRQIAGAIMHKLGCTTMIKRAVAMVKSGFLFVTKQEKKYLFQKTNIANDQFLDDMEFSYLNELEQKIKKHQEKRYGGWELIDIENYSDVSVKPGFFLGVKSQEEEKISSYILPNIDSLMKPLIRMWDSGRGLMIEYDTTPEIDNHFFAIATNLVHDWRNEAGFHPEAKFNGVKGADVAMIVLLIVSFHLKHIRFTALASEEFPNINIPQTLTLWAPLEEFANGIARFTGVDIAIVLKSIDIIMMKFDDAESMRQYSSRFMPLLINLGNGFVLRPVSGIIRNPFATIITLLEHRNLKVRHEISAHREEWLRNHLYAIFGGVRYQTVDGNVKLRIGNSMITDIDAAIYDNLTGELALFQIKWQDFFFNDVKKLRSKASNLTREMDEWCEKVSDWITQNGTAKLGKSLRLRNGTGNLITSIYLFGISRNAARMNGYGFSIKSDNLAIANWPQFVRHRFEIGPGEKVISKIFSILKSKEYKKIVATPLPYEFLIGESILRFEDLWAELKTETED